MESPIENLTPAQPTIAAPKQTPGCLPEGYTLDSLLTPKQFAIWQQSPLSTVRDQLPSMKGVIRRSRENIRIHPRTYLELSIKSR